MDGRPDDSASVGAEAVWSIVAYLVGGPAVWGAIGYAVDRLTDTSVFLPIGVAIGVVGSFYLVYLRYVRD